MKALIERQLYSPSVVLPMVAFMELLVSHDFNLGQVGAVVAISIQHIQTLGSFILLAAHLFAFLRPQDR